ncbi:hypothetical protein HMPREF9080_02151 [Cardiobacterium valvarum F0432]|uniref:Uncharacterized protein n=1 Tax=Cardiobacterium valvarum F0432 TaxID=797473 RepID=G9ZH94_9GAMM|nr:hypothetical protein HMPREF9080_02151 [Cardiobacterium valvarum F0432]
MFAPLSACPSRNLAQKFPPLWGGSEWGQQTNRESSKIQPPRRLADPVFTPLGGRPAPFHKPHDYPAW